MPYTSPNQDKDLGLLKAFVFSALLAGCSNTGDMEFQPVDKDLTNKQLGQNVTLAILSFPDKRPPVKGFAWSKKLATKPEKNLDW